jgi:farnesyl-diphosphate farnesyltransferase
MDGSGEIEWSQAVLEDVSRTFALSISLLDSPMQAEIRTGYLLCRVADTIEDARHIPPGEKVALLNTYRSVLTQDNPTTPADFRSDVEQWVPNERSGEWKLVTETPRLIDRYQALPDRTKAQLRPPIQAMLHGMAAFIARYEQSEGLRIQTIEELETYCWYVAGTVGELVTEIVLRDTNTSDVLAESAPSFGLLLQLVNITRDIATDYREENNVYVPERVLSAHGLSHTDIADDTQSAAFRPVVERLVEEAESHIADTRAWLASMPETRGNTLAAWAVPFLLAVATLRELRTAPAAVLTAETVKVDREEVFAIVDAVTPPDPEPIEQLQQEIHVKPYHE